MKATFHKSCNCASCRRGRNHIKRNANERKLRQRTREAIHKLKTGKEEDVFIAPISSPYTD